ncbi:MAG: septum formation protein Maf [Burkholderiales bacterium]|nr:septum formation protein Maf [Burkholderiales bacterium]MCW5575656.1 septum formation protein Maf [Burkholderiales bacterium]MCW5606170.1 septum formation protein Maf [Burkholderiales bacterium]
MTPHPPIVLASSSAYRRALLARIGIDCPASAPEIDESPLHGEAPAATALRLAHAKALKIGERESLALIIGSDQVAVLGGRILGKPGTHAAAIEQLRAMSGNTVVFHTALCLLNAATGAMQTASVPTTVRFRKLETAQIERYLRQDRPYDCAGSAKIESLGIALVERVESDDPTALIGLPLIALTGMLRQEGVVIP